MGFANNVIPAWLLVGGMWQDEVGKWWCDPYKNIRKDYEPDTTLGPFDTREEAIDAWKKAP